MRLFSTIDQTDMRVLRAENGSQSARPREKKGNGDFLGGFDPVYVLFPWEYRRGGDIAPLVEDGPHHSRSPAKVPEQEKSVPCLPVSP